MVGYVAPLPFDVYTFKELHREEDENGTYILPMDAGWTQMRETERCSPVRGRMDTISETAASRLVRITIETVDGCPFQWNTTPAGCDGCSFAPPEGGFEYIGVMLQVVKDGLNGAESRKLDIEGATQLRSLRSRLFVDGQEVLLGTTGLPDSSDPLTTWTNTGLSPFFLEDGVPGPTGDQIVFHDPNNPSNQDYPGYRLVGTPGDVTVNPLDPGDDTYSGVVLHLYNFDDLAVDRIELDLVFDLESPGDLNADRVVDDVEYASLFASMPPADPGATTGAGPSLFDGLEAQAVLTPLGTATPNDGDGIDTFLLQETGARDSFYRSAPGFLNTLGGNFIDIIIQMLEATGQSSRVRVLLFEQSYELVRFQAGYLIADGIEFLEIDLADGLPTMKARFVGDVQFGYIEVWYERYSTRTTIFEFDDIPVSDFGAAGQRLRHFFQMAKEIQTGLGMALGLYSVYDAACPTLEEWAEIYRPNNQFGFCVSACQAWFNTFQTAGGIFSAAFGNWGGALLMLAPAYCSEPCDQYISATPGSVLYRRLEGAHFFLLGAAQDCYQVFP